MLTRKTTLLTALCVMVLARGTELPRWEISELGLPANQPSEAVDINERNQLLGKMGPGGAEIGFVWQGHQLQFLNSIGTRAFPRDINNFGVVVGSFASNSTLRARAWSNGVNLNLSQGTSATVATAINDRGEIIGAQEISIYPYIYRLSQPTARLSPDVILPISMLDRYRGGGAYGLNNNGVVVGQFIGYGFVSTNWAEQSWPTSLGAPAAPDVWAESAALAVNSLNHIAGWVRTRTRFNQPAVWWTNQWITLPSSLQSNAAVESINDFGWMVGTLQSPQTAMIWKDGAGADLNSFVDLPPGSRLTAAVAINNSGYIAATLLAGETPRAVLLKPVRDGAIPKMEIAGPDETVLRTNRLSVTINTPYVGTSGRTVTYRLYERVQTKGYDGLSTMKEYRTEQARTMVMSGETISALFENLRPAHYLLTAELNDTNGLMLYSSPITFVVSERPQLTAYRVNWSGGFQFTMRPTPGQEYELEESTDLVTWTPVNLRASGGGFVQPATNTARRFYRTALASEWIGIDSRMEGVMQEAPAAIPAEGANIYLVDLIEIRLFGDRSFVANNRRGGPQLLSGTYDYRPGRYSARLTLRDENPDIQANLEIEFPLIIPHPQGQTYRPTVRGTITGPDGSIEGSGFFYID